MVFMKLKAIHQERTSRNLKIREAKKRRKKKSRETDYGAVISNIIRADRSRTAKER